MHMDLRFMYALMLRSRLYEEAIAQLWREGLISGEMHLGTGEEAIVAGVVSHLGAEDALALDHRGTAPLIMRGVDPVLILRELLGHRDGLCRGQGGHMHLMSKEHLSAASGIVGAAGPAAAGFALAAQQLRPGSIAVGFFGEGAVNQGMVMEELNLASVWALPALFVCKDDEWSITTQSESVTGGDLERRVEGLGVQYVQVDGRDVEPTWRVAGEAIAGIRSGRGPCFLHARCVHLEAHFLGFQLLRAVREPLAEIPRLAGPMTRSFLQPRGAPVAERVAGMSKILESMISTLQDARRDPANDPLLRARAKLEPDDQGLEELEQGTTEEVAQALGDVLGGGSS